jgi:hypothetical protein
MINLCRRTKTKRKGAKDRVCVYVHALNFCIHLLMPHWLGLCVLRMTWRQNRLHETFFHTVIILSKHYLHHHMSVLLVDSTKEKIIIQKNLFIHITSQLYVALFYFVLVAFFAYYCCLYFYFGL